MDTNFTDNFLVKKSKFNLKDFNTDYKRPHQEEGQKMLDAEKKNSTNFKKSFIDGSQSLLIVIQAMDVSEKHLIEHVFGGVNRKGCEVTSFKNTNF
ncbi:hypothetical protein MASR1M29_14060 [Cloacibacterium normanense]